MACCTFHAPTGTLDASRKCLCTLQVFDDKARFAKAGRSRLAELVVPLPELRFELRGVPPRLVSDSGMLAAATAGAADVDAA